MSDWRETKGDEWGPIYFENQDERHSYATIVEDRDGAAFVDADDVPIELVRALLRAHDLRTKAPGTECEQCPGNGRIPYTGKGWQPCPCHGSGRNMTPAETKRWREWPL